jgi:rSAM/selenodomain-associated transferase 2
MARRQARWTQAIRTNPAFWTPGSDRSQSRVAAQMPPTRHRDLISIVIPTLNEASNLPQVLDRISVTASLEVIVVDGGSTDDTLAIAAAWGARTVTSTTLGRSHQMNQGAGLAKGSVLLFLHADTRLPHGFEPIIHQTLAQPDVVAGAFQLAIDSPQRALRWVEWGVNLRSRRFHMPYGDQAIFIKANVFHSLGGFPELPMMEDFELIRQLKSLGKIVIAPATVSTSDRRWRSLGIFRTTLANQVMIAAYLIGVDPHKLARWYRHLGKTCP